jgi:hypothetical protein
LPYEVPIQVSIGGGSTARISITRLALAYS